MIRLVQLPDRDRVSPERPDPSRVPTVGSTIAPPEGTPLSPTGLDAGAATAKPVDPLQSPEVGLAEQVVEAWTYRERTAIYSRYGYTSPNFPDEYPFKDEPHPDWCESYSEELDANAYLAGLLDQAHGDLGVVYAAARLSKREAQTFGLRISGMSWWEIGEEAGFDGHKNGPRYWNNALAKFSALLRAPRITINEEINEV